MIPETINSIYPLFIGGLLRIIKKGVMGVFFFTMFPFVLCLGYN